jgi:hypothetical protein
MLKKLASQSALFYIATSLFVLIAIYAVLAVTDIDEDLSVELAAELKWPEPVYDEKNAFYAFLGLPHLRVHEELWQLGWKIANTDFEYFQKLDQSIWGRNVAQNTQIFKLPCDSTLRSCISQNIEQAKKARDWLKNNYALAESIEKIVRSDIFYEQISLNQHYVESWRLLDGVRQAKWATASEAWSQSQEASALETIAPYLKFCRGLLKTAATLQTKTLAISCVNNDMRLLADWYLLKPHMRSVLSERLSGWLEPIELNEIRMREPLMHEIRLYSKSGDAFINGALEVANVESREDLFDFEKMNSRRSAALLMVYFTKTNDVARAAYQKFEGFLLLSESGAAVPDLPWEPNRSKPLKSYLPRGIIGHHVLQEIPLEQYEHYLHNAQSPLMYQVLLKAVIFCAQKINKNDIENCLKSDINEYRESFYSNSAKLDPERMFLWLPAPDVLVKKRGYIRLYINL